MSELKEMIIEALKEVYDPEIPINVYDLGLIYEVSVTGNLVHITMSLTSPTCPTAEYIQEMIASAIKVLPGVKDVEIELTFEPRWTPDRVSDDAKEELGLEVSEKPDLAISNVFGDSNSEKEHVCFKCLVNDNKVPLIKVVFESSEKLMCVKCLKL